MGQTHFSGPVISEAGFQSATGTFSLPTYSVASVPSAVTNIGSIIYVTNGAAGTAIVAFSDGTSWLRVDTKAAIAAA